MAESVPYSDQLVTLFKIREGYANTNSAYEVEQETLVSRPTQLADRIFLNNVPDNAPTDLVQDLSWNVVAQSSAQRWTSVARPWLVNYRALVLTSFAGNPDETFYFAGTRGSGGALPNLLTNMLLPLMTSTSAPAYTVAVSDISSALIPASNYMLDRQAGIITIYPGNGVSATRPPILSFWRYEGTTLRDAAMSTDLCGNVTLAGTLAVAGNVNVGGTLVTNNFSTTTFTTTGLYTARGGITVAAGNLDISSGAILTQTLTSSGLITARNGLTVPAGTVSVANAASVGSLSTTGNISANTASVAGLLQADSLSTTGSITAGSGVSVTGGSLTVTNNTTTGTLTVTSGPNTLGAVTTGALTATGLINASAGLSVSGGISIPGASLTLNDLCANAVDVSGTLRVGMGTVGNNLVISTTDASTSYIRQTDVSSGTIIFGASVSNPAGLFIRDSGPAGSGFVAITNGTAGSATLNLTGSNTACTIVPNVGSGNSVRIGSGFLNPSAIVVSDSNTTVNGTLIAPTIIGTGVTVSIGDISGVTIGPSTSFGGAFNGSVISANASTQPRIGLRSTYPDGSSNIIYWDGQALLPGREKPRAGGYGLGIPNYGWENTYTNNIYPVISPGTVTVNGTLIAPTIGVAGFISGQPPTNTTTVNSALHVGGYATTNAYLHIEGGSGDAGGCAIYPTTGTDPSISLGNSSNHITTSIGVIRSTATLATRSGATGTSIPITSNNLNGSWAISTKYKINLVIVHAGFEIQSGNSGYVTVASSTSYSKYLNSYTDSTVSKGNYWSVPFSGIFVIESNGSLTITSTDAIARGVCTFDIIGLA